MKSIFAAKRCRGKDVLYFLEMASSNPTYVEMGEGDLPTRLKLLDDSVPFDSPLLVAYAVR